MRRLALLLICLVVPGCAWGRASLVASWQPANDVEVRYEWTTAPLKFSEKSDAVKEF